MAINVSSVAKDIHECELYVSTSQQDMDSEGIVWRLRREACIEADRAPARMLFWTPGATTPNFGKKVRRPAPK